MSLFKSISLEHVDGYDTMPVSIRNLVHNRPFEGDRSVLAVESQTMNREILGLGSNPAGMPWCVL